MRPVILSMPAKTATGLERRSADAPPAAAAANTMPMASLRENFLIDDTVRPRFQTPACRAEGHINRPKHTAISQIRSRLQFHASAPAVITKPLHTFARHALEAECGQN